ncbi:DUF779 domain-containing protein [Silvibacterium dinghuense]|uniref:DUF779 domain-containing protein n=1 Tax=Silvibacterium dinghuense TaxID=1560006 RepID=A0A4Q1SJG0_9BACT|nr:DUF779 domain-containing protein [Silvibacterium dinghuense]RXS97410.1 DUF779 domain-containing protein [Silvibacterium dinghuense]GGG98789.1 acetaldehyde dehydrogenase [Silvibacterium dinghuense]
MPEVPDQVTATPAALKLIDELKAEHGPIMFYQSGGCCEGSAPMCFPEGEFRIGSRDVKLGEIGGAPFYISKPQFEYWKHTQLVIDVTPGFGAAFSLEGPGGLQFLTRSHVFTDDEIHTLRDAGRI